ISPFYVFFMFLLYAPLWQKGRAFFSYFAPVLRPAAQDLSAERADRGSVYRPKQTIGLELCHSRAVIVINIDTIPWPQGRCPWTPAEGHCPSALPTKGLRYAWPAGGEGLPSHDKGPCNAR